MRSTEDLTGWALVSVLIGITGLITGNGTIAMIGIGSSLILFMGILTDMQNDRKDQKVS
jgi:hypothetical protein